MVEENAVPSCKNICSPFGLAAKKNTERQPSDSQRRKVKVEDHKLNRDSNAVDNGKGGVGKKRDKKGWDREVEKSVGEEVTGVKKSRPVICLRQE